MQKESKHWQFDEKYSEWMPEKVRSLGKNGRATKALIAQACGVSKRTIERWKNPQNPYYKPEFEQAYDHAKRDHEAFHENKAFDAVENSDDKFPAVTWQMLMRRHCGYSEHRTVKNNYLSNAKTYGEQAIAIRKGLADGSYTPKEAAEIANALATLAKVADYEQILNEINELKKQRGA